MRPFESAELNLVSKILFGIGSVAIVLMMLHITVDVVAKFALNMPLPWTSEIVSVYYMVTIIFLPLGAVSSHRGGQIIIEFFTMHLSRRKQKRFDLFAALLTIIYLVLFFYCTFIAALDQSEAGEAWTTGYGDVAVWPARWMLPLGLTVMALVVLVQIVNYVRAIRFDEAEADE